MRIVVIGAGIAGMASAVRLAAKGYQVDVFEHNSYPGGKLTEFNSKNYRFDAGPSLLATPELIDELFVYCGKNPRDYINYTKCDVNCVYFYADGTTFKAYHNKELFYNELKQKTGLLNVKPVEKYLKQISINYKIVSPVFLEQSLHKFNSYLNLKTLRGVLNMWRLNLFSSMNEVNVKQLKNKYLVQYFNRFATYNGSNPYKAPGLLNVIASLEHNAGTFIPKGGMHAITRAVYQLALDMGVNFYFNKKVNNITTNKQQKITGIKTDLGNHNYDIVINNNDIYNTYKKLLNNNFTPHKIINQEKSSSALIFYWGIKKQFNNLHLHNIFFTNNYEAEFNCIFNQKNIYADPTIYINITSKYEHADAPPNCENWFVMINTPNNNGQNWQEIIPAARKNIISKLSSTLNCNIEDLIEFEEVLDPISIEAKTGSHAGALYGNASNNRFSAFLRHKNFSGKLKGLYFCGGSVHPGGGIPLCLYSAKIVSEIIDKDYK